MTRPAVLLAARVPFGFAARPRRALRRDRAAGAAVSARRGGACRPPMRSARGPWSRWARSTPRAAAMAALPALGLVACVGSGYEGVDLAAARERGIVVTHSPGANASAVADLALGLIIATVRRFPEGQAFLRDGEWRGNYAQPNAGRPRADRPAPGRVRARCDRREDRAARRGVRDGDRLSQPAAPGRRRPCLVPVAASRSRTGRTSW